MDATSNRVGKFGSGGAGLARSGRAQFGTGSASALSMKWSALHDAAQAVAGIAGIPAPSLTQAIRAFPAQVRDAHEAHRIRAEQGIADLSAIMEAGLGALLASLARGSHPRGAALALWNEFVNARDALLDIAPAPDGHPKRMA
ncbi:hypothetical protein MTR62_18200 [Novosphingobium sp. 1949]|uniref:Uncharacterized protein n=1 Tax=Novosphingobium organovorum TaxID=2930092 RepID=A0ABT0BIG4_9SPHN|nr:hypothetical protein [Novosphingobium organovorum]MCJ2184606.1 hypothetical protein [Novosphingobium organovorum]